MLCVGVISYLLQAPSVSSPEALKSDASLRAVVRLSEPTRTSARLPV